jgi:hypothetical protein
MADDGGTEETRVRWVQAQGRAEAVVGKIRDMVNEGVGRTEEALHIILNVLNNSKEKVYHSFESHRGEDEGGEKKDRVDEKAKGEL